MKEKKIIKEEVDSKYNDINEKKISCLECGKELHNLCGSHLKKHGMDAKSYKDKYGQDKPVYSESWMSKQKRGDDNHMTKPEYKKLFSDMFKGDKNPNSKSKTTEYERNSRSPHCIEFYQRTHPDKTDTERDVMLIDFKSGIDRGVSNTTIEFYIERGFGEEESKKMLSDRQNTVSLSSLQNKYGDIEGKIKYDERNEKWLKSLHGNGNLKSGYSEISQDLFRNVETRRPGNYKFFTKNREMVVGSASLDFVDLDTKKVIEFNGDIFHANPSIYKSTDNPNPFIKDKSSQFIWDRDYSRNEKIESLGYKIFIVWESDYKNNKEQIILDCINFLDSYGN